MRTISLLLIATLCLGAPAIAVEANPTGTPTVATPTPAATSSPTRTPGLQERVVAYQNMVDELRDKISQLQQALAANLGALEEARRNLPAPTRTARGW
ncbi:MAG: hypothetical protein SF182_01670 [Deltaproteobacteria bacterium]|nr:hypothetical protein [Deltaproteobacteria bacterium]